QVRDMLGLADRARVFDLFEHVMKGQMADALDMMGEQYALGADPAVVLQDMLELAHWLTRLKITPDDAEIGTASETERVRGASMAQGLSMAQLTRAWQMLLKGLAETRSAPNPLQAAEMAVVRLAYAADLPSPAELAEQLRANPPAPRGPGGGGSGGGSGGSGGVANAMAGSHVGPGGPGGATALKMAPAPDPVQLPPMPASFAEVAALVSEKREGIVAVALRTQINLVRFEPGRIEYRPHASAPNDLAQKLGRLLGEWTGRRWIVTVNTNDPAKPTLAEQEITAERKRREDAANHPLVQAVMAAFPGAVVEVVRDMAPEPEEAELAFDADTNPGEEES
ncbi:MAG: DNA polymerase III subunit gamma/tau, partial [Magnetospirillum sp.]|nr:DNA polymerase III subunit gamma/tau [Magnetospirillum sp.]